MLPKQMPAQQLVMQRKQHVSSEQMLQQIPTQGLAGAPAAPPNPAQAQPTSGGLDWVPTRAHVIRLLGTLSDRELIAEVHRRNLVIQEPPPASFTMEGQVPHAPRGKTFDEDIERRALDRLRMERSSHEGNNTSSAYTHPVAAHAIPGWAEENEFSISADHIRSMISDMRPPGEDNAMGMHSPPHKSTESGAHHGGTLLAQQQEHQPDQQEHHQEHQQHQHQHQREPSVALS